MVDLLARSGNGTSAKTAKREPVVWHVKDIATAVRTVTPSKARHWRDTKHFDRQRKINAANVNRLRKEMEAGRFIPGTQIYICVLPDGTELIINGNHTLEALYESGIPQELVLTYKRVADTDEAGRIYAVFDIHKARTWLDSLKAAGREDLGELAPKALSAIGCINSGFHHLEAARDGRLERIDQLEEYKDAVELFAAAISNSTSETGRYVKRAAVMAVALETFRYQPSLAAEFWMNFASDNGLIAGMAERALLSWCRNAKLGTGRNAQKMQARACALAWNAAFKGEERDHVKPGAMGEFFLLGTPWAKGVKVE